MDLPGVFIVAALSVLGSLVILMHPQPLVGCHNMVLDDRDNVKLCDFAGSSLDGSKPLVCCHTRSRIPGRDKTDELTDIFALGSAMYELITTHEPYEDMHEWEVDQQYTKAIFPTLPQGQAYKRVASIFRVARRCWKLHVESADEVVRLLEAQETAWARRREGDASQQVVKTEGPSCGLPRLLMSLMKEKVILPTLAWMKQSSQTT